MPEFLSHLRQLAASKDMTYFDRTEESRRVLRDIGNPNPTGRTDGFLLNVGVYDEGGPNLGVGELGGPGYQIGIGFNYEGAKPEARAFASEVIQSLRTRWRVEVYSGEVGLQPMKVCGPE